MHLGPCGLLWRWATFAGEDGVAHDRIDVTLPAASAEHAVVADAGLAVMASPTERDPVAEVLRRGSLTDAADVIALTLDGEQEGPPDRRRVDELSSPIQLAASEPVLLEDLPHGLEVELGSQIEHGEVLPVELLGLSRLRVLLRDRSVNRLANAVAWRLPFIAVNAAS